MLTIKLIFQILVKISKQLSEVPSYNQFENYLMNSLDDLILKCRQSMLSGNQSYYEDIKALISKQNSLHMMLNLVDKDQNIFSCYCCILRTMLLSKQIRLASEQERLLYKSQYKKYQASYFIHIFKHFLQFFPEFKSRSQTPSFKFLIALMGTLLKVILEDVKPSRLKDVLQQNLFCIHKQNSTPIDKQYEIFLVLKIMRQCLNSCIAQENLGMQLVQFKNSLIIFRKYITRAFLTQTISLVSSIKRNKMQNQQLYRCSIEIVEQIFHIFKSYATQEDEEHQKDQGLDVNLSVYEYKLLPIWFLTHTLDCIELIQRNIEANLTKNLQKILWSLQIFNCFIKAWVSRPQIQEYLLKYQFQMMQRSLKIIEMRLINSLNQKIQSQILSGLLIIIQNYSSIVISEFIKVTSFIDVLFKYFSLIMNVCPFLLQEGVYSPTVLAFKVLHQLKGYISNEVLYKKTSETYLMLFTNNLMDSVKDQHQFPDFTEQIQIYESCFEHQKSIFMANYQQNFSSIKQCNINFGNSNKKITVFIIYMLKNCNSLLEAELLIVLVQKLRNQSGFCFLFAIKTILEIILSKSYPVQGKQQTFLSIYIQKQMMYSFEGFIQLLIKQIIFSLKNSNSYLIDFGLNLLQFVVQKIVARKQYWREFKQYQVQKNYCYSIIQQFIRHGQLDNIKSQLSHRERLYQLVGMLWVDNTPQPCYTFYNLIKKQLQSGNIEGLLNYLVDCRGLIKNITNSYTFKIIVQLICLDYPSIQQHFFPININHLISNCIFSQKLITFIYQISINKNLRITNQKQSDIAIRIYDTFKRTLSMIGYHINQQIEQLVMKCYQNFSSFVLLDQLPPLPKFNTTSTYCKFVLNNYFQNLYRVPNFEQMLDYCPISLLYLQLWVNEMIQRQLTPEIDFRVLFISANISNSTGLRTLANIAYDLSKYNAKYSLMNINNRQDYINNFILAYKHDI